VRVPLRRFDWPLLAALLILAGWCAPLSAAAAVTVSPNPVFLSNGGTQHFEASADGATSGFSWTLEPSGVASGSINQAGDYSAPALITERRVVTVKATAWVGATLASGTATVVLEPSQVTVQIAPRENLNLTAGQSMTFVAAVAGADNKNVNWTVSGGGSVSTSVGTTTVYTAPASSSIPAAGKTVTLTATSVAAPSISDSVSINLVPTVAISITPTSATLGPAQSQTFVATVTGNADTSVTWSISPNVGTISGGVYTAPSSITASQTVYVTATSHANPNRTATATVALQPGITVSVKATTTSLSSSDTTAVTATVTGTSNTAVVWSLSPNLGTISGSGATVAYTAPDSITATTSVTVIATSVADTTRSGSVTLTLTKSSSVGIVLTPKTVTLAAGEQQQFTATVSGTATTNVYWSISPNNLGTINQSGLYIAPSSITSSQTVTVTAASLADPTKTATATITLAATTTATDVGSGAPNAAIQQLFIQAFYRNGFHNLVSLPPSAKVRQFGTVGWYQTFSDANKSGLTYAIVMPSSALNLPNGDPASAWQVWGDVWSGYNSIGSATAGYPTGDTQVCGFFSESNSCTFQYFDKNHVVFGYKNALATGQTFSIRNTFYTAWVALGDINGLGRPVEAESSVTSPKGGAATMQVYSSGVTFNITTAATNLPAGKTFSVRSPIYDLYLTKGGYAGSLGFPISDEITLSNGLHRQQFQDGAIEYTPGSDPSERPPVAAIAMQIVSGMLNMKLGETAQVTATPISAAGASLTDRVVSWSTSNGRVVQIEGSGPTVTLKAVGAGNARVTATSEGKTSAPLQVVVTSQCCQVGEGSPTAAIQQAFLDVVARDKLNFVLPSENAVKRVGGGYTQELISADTGARYLLAKPDSLASAYHVTGSLLTRYLELGGPAGSLGYPVSNATAGGRQMFENSTALAGSPVRAVSGAILAKWALLGYESGAAGFPASDAGSSFVTFTTSAGSVQSFAGGNIYSVTAGVRSGQSYFVSGAILARYLALGGPTGVFGLPVGDEVVSGDLRQQGFEGGTIEYRAGDSAAVDHPAARQPAVVATPGTAIAGTRVRVAVYGFADGSTLKISVAGKADFQVETARGAYSWDVYVPLGAAPGTVAIHAVDIQSNASADGSYVIKSYLESGVGLIKVQGDGQTGLPGARLPQALRVALRDQSGNPITGATVTFAASPGAGVSPATAVTDSAGLAETWLRLPAAGGTAMATADASGIAPSPVTFSAVAQSSRLQSFPVFTQASEKGALAAAAAAILRYHQDRGELPSTNGLADPSTLTQFLTAYCTPVCDGFVSNPEGGDQVVNLWRVGEFAGGGVDVSVESADENTIRDLVAQGYPVLLSLALSADGVPAGGHYLVAIGASANGSVLVYDPSADFARASLADYTAGFAAAGHTWKGELRGAVRLAVRAPSATRFLLAAVSQPPAAMQKLTLEAVSAAGSCGTLLELVDAAVPSAAVSGAPRVSRFLACDGSQPVYQIHVGAGEPFRASLTDFATGGGSVDISGSAPAAWRATRPTLLLVLTPQVMELAANALVNSVTLAPGTAPGGLASILGSGLSGPGGNTIAALDGYALPLIPASPFRLNVRIPEDIPPGNYTLRLQSPFGISEQSVEIRQVAPVIFLLERGRGALVNPAGTINSPLQPVRRGETLLIYAIGLGGLVQEGDLSAVTVPVTAVVNGQELPVAFAGWTAGLDAGIYQVNLTIPTSFSPGVDLPLVLRQGGQESNVVPMSIE